ncbi:hypothetical protein [Falsirhodobacter sp. 1013]|uniref:hypothetical protein n=1 Tax=Falsirhodobacter sp. 1013 TaxID=3417566 RepID=UPI003EBFFFB9
MRLIALALILLPTAALADLRKFTLVNHTAVNMTELYASPTVADSWEEDILNGEDLTPMGIQTFTIKDGRDHCAYDIRAVFADEEVLLDTVDVCHAEVLEMLEEDEGEDPQEKGDIPVGQAL